MYLLMYTIVSLSHRVIALVETLYLHTDDDDDNLISKLLTDKESL